MTTVEVQVADVRVLLDAYFGVGVDERELARAASRLDHVVDPDPGPEEGEGG